MLPKVTRGSRDSLSSQAHLVAGMYKLEDLRLAFLGYLDAKEAEVHARQATGASGQVAAGEPQGGRSTLSEWL